MECFAVNGSNAEVLVCGSSEGHLFFMLLPELQCIRIVDLTANGAIRSLRFSEGIWALSGFRSYLQYFVDSQYLMIGSQNGTFSICVDVRRYKRQDEIVGVGTLSNRFGKELSLGSE